MAGSNVVLPRLKVAPSLRARIEARYAALKVPDDSSSGTRRGDAPDFGVTPGVVVPTDHSEDSEQTGAFVSPLPAEPLFDTIISLQALADRPQDGIEASKEILLAELRKNYPELRVEVSQFYLRVEATAVQIDVLSHHPCVDVIWPNNPISGHLLTSAETVRASAGWRTFEARGDGICWAVLDTGINAKHPHFLPLATIDAGLSKSFVQDDPLTDVNGHGTHVAGIIAGAAPPAQPDKPYTVVTMESDNFTKTSQPLKGAPSGIAPSARLISVQVLKASGGGHTFDCIRGLEYIRGLNQNSRSLRVDGANLSLGYDLDAASYGCGHSPICEEVNRCVDAGICVVVSCGNSGFGVIQAEAAGVTTQVKVGMAASISDPANADLCIAVGSVHKRAPHKYGVSYFSSKGPTLDGRPKPDLVAPGEKIYSCSSDLSSDLYVEMSGTSMAAPHVSGAIAAFLSVRPDFRGNPREVKRIFKESALDLGRDVSYQGSGMVDAFKALTSV